eukprot:3863377-Rhodomonas_salina.3
MERTLVHQLMEIVDNKKIPLTVVGGPGAGNQVSIPPLVATCSLSATSLPICTGSTMSEMLVPLLPNPWLLGVDYAFGGRGRGGPWRSVPRILERDLRRTPSPGLILSAKRSSLSSCSREKLALFTFSDQCTD